MVADYNISKYISEDVGRTYQLNLTLTYRKKAVWLENFQIDIDSEMKRKKGWELIGMLNVLQSPTFQDVLVSLFSTVLI